MNSKVLLCLVISVIFIFSCSPQTEKIQMNSDNESNTDVIEINNPNNSATGNLKITISEGSDRVIFDFGNMAETKTIGPEIDMTTDSFKITATCTNGLSFKLTTQLSSIEVQGVPIGKWKIQIEALNIDKTSIAYGQSMVDIYESLTSELTVYVVRYAGFGNMDITVNWEAGLQNPYISASIFQNNGPSYDIKLEITGKTAKATIKNLAVGYYILRVNLYEGTEQMPLYVGGAVEMIRIAENQTTPGLVNIVENSAYGYGDIDININVDMKDPIDIMLGGQTASIYSSQIMTVQASSPLETENIEYNWYLNGEHIGAGEVCITRAGLPAGNYRLDVIAFNETGDRGGSVSYFFEVLIDPPVNLTYGNNPAIYIANLPIQENIAAVTGLNITFSISPSLPEGLSMDVNTGTISGTPVYAQNEAHYTAAASNSSGTTSVDLLITIIAEVPVLSAADFDTDHIDLSWTYDFPDIGGYEIYRSTTPGVYDYNDPLAVITTTQGYGSYADNTVMSNTTYYYTIRAFYGSTFSNSSNEVVATSAPGFSEYLAGRWKLDGNLLDSAGTSNGTAYGSPAPVFVEGVNGLPNTALQFNADNNNYVDFGSDKFGIDTTNQFTVVFWLRLDGPAQFTILKKGNFGYPFWLYRMGGLNRLGWAIRTNTPNYITGNHSLNPGEWYHIALNYGNGYTKLFINGIEDKSDSLTGTLNLDGSNEELYIGGSPWGENSDISISDLRIYNTCLAGVDIYSIYNSTQNAPVLKVTDISYRHMDLSWTYDYPYISGYEIYRSTVPGVFDYNDPLAVITTTANSYAYTDNTVVLDVNYYYVIRSIYGPRYSLASNELNVKVPASWIFSGLQLWLKLEQNLVDSGPAVNSCSIASGSVKYQERSANNYAAYTVVNDGHSAINIPKDPEFINDKFTLAFWVQTTRAWSNAEGMFAQGRYYPNNHANGLAINISATQLGLYYAGSAGQDNRVSIIQPINSNWHFFVFCFDLRVGSGGTCIVYMDNSLFGTMNLTDWVRPNPAEMYNHLFVSGNNNKNWVGQLDEVMYWNRLLTESEALSLQSELALFNIQ